jgi:hypothetical protein
MEGHSILDAVAVRVSNPGRTLRQAQPTTLLFQYLKYLELNIILSHIQGADDKLGQFLDQDIEASANHRNVLQHSLESCPSLVSFNVNKPSIFIKICRQNQNLCRCPKSFARRKKSTGDCKVSKSAQFLGGLHFEKFF